MHTAKMGCRWQKKKKKENFLTFVSPIHMPNKLPNSPYAKSCVRKTFDIFETNFETFLWKQTTQSSGNTEKIFSN